MLDHFEQVLNFSLCNLICKLFNSSRKNCKHYYCRIRYDDYVQYAENKEEKAVARP